MSDTAVRRRRLWPGRNAPARTWRPGGGLDAHCNALVHLYTSESAQVVALRGVDLDIDSGEMLALLGPSGTGKSTLLKLLSGLIQPTAGRIVVGGRNLRGLSGRELRTLRATEIGIVLQDAGTNLLPYATGEQNVWFAQIGARRAKHPVQNPADVLDQLDLGPLAGRARTTSRAVNSSSSPSPSALPPARTCSLSTSRPASSTPGGATPPLRCCMP